MLTVEDLYNPERKSNYNHVGVASTKSNPSKKPFQANWRVGNTVYKLKRRATAKESAQDFCDYVNGKLITLPTEQWETPEVDMGNGDKRHAPKSEPVKVVRKDFTGPHDLYDVEILAPVTKAFVVRKVGITARGHSRYNDISKTFGFTIKPLSRAITYSTKAKAKKAEDDLIAKLCADKNWKRVGKEAFVPVER